VHAAIASAQQAESSAHTRLATRARRLRKVVSIFDLRVNGQGLPDRGKDNPLPSLVMPRINAVMIDVVRRQEPLRSHREGSGSQPQHGLIASFDQRPRESAVIRGSQYFSIGV
jgi:hypothetical protein